MWEYVGFLSSLSQNDHKDTLHKQKDNFFLNENTETYLQIFFFQI